MTGHTMTTSHKDIAERTTIRDTPSGPSRFRQLTAMERVRLELRALACEAFGKPVDDVPDEWRDWTYHLRKGHLTIGGGTLRFIALCGKRHSVAIARQFAERAIALEIQAMNILLPADPTDPTKGRTVPFTQPVTDRESIRPRGIGGRSPLGNVDDGPHGRAA